MQLRRAHEKLEQTQELAYRKNLWQVFCNDLGKNCCQDFANNSSQE